MDLIHPVVRLCVILDNIKVNNSQKFQRNQEISLVCEFIFSVKFNFLCREVCAIAMILQSDLCGQAPSLVSALLNFLETPYHCKDL